MGSVSFTRHLGHCEKTQLPYEPLVGLNEYLPVVTGHLVCTARVIVKTLFTNICDRGNLLCNLIRTWITILHGKGQGAVCALSSGFAP